MHKNQKAFQLEENDNVATVLGPISRGDVSIIGDSNLTELFCRDKVPQGHKIAVKDIEAGEDILKYGVRIGRATKSIQQGEWVHLHDMCSCYDERSAHLDIYTGVPLDVSYE